MDANQSRPRVALDQASESKLALPSEVGVGFRYQPLDASLDCMRLVEIEPSDDPYQIPICSLVHVAFGKKPKYEALSYMWGDESCKKKIRLNGQVFYVGQNLWDALRFLRNRGSGLRYWIDAISINQIDVDERNRQLRIMPHIYTRAQTVLVWLGKKYAHYPAGSCDEPTKPTTDSSLLLEDLCSDPYWNRVWIVQEIGKARKIQICYGEVEEAWDTVIDNITRQSRKTRNKKKKKWKIEEDRLEVDYHEMGPMRLERGRKEKYNGGHTLRALLENHQHAVCKDPRDKIYGFVGLAADAVGFPMDYQKSLWEVWKDTMLFANKGGILPESETIFFGRLLKRLLGGSCVGSVNDIIQLNAYQSRALPDEPTLSLPAYIVGMIVYAGPSPEQVVSSLAAADSWEAQLSRNFPNNLGNTIQESDSLVQMLLDTEDIDFGLHSFPESVSYLKCERDANCILERYKKVHDDRKKSLQISNERRCTVYSLEEPTLELSPSELRLYQVKSLSHQYKEWEMGIAKGKIQAGDLICCVRGVQIAMVTRTNGESLEIIGTAVSAIDVCGLDEKKDYKGKKSKEKEYDDKVGCSGEVQLGVEVEAVYVLASLESDFDA